VAISEDVEIAGDALQRGGTSIFERYLTNDFVNYVLLFLLIFFFFLQTPTTVIVVLFLKLVVMGVE
jgi:hypothetical protein